MPKESRLPTGQRPTHYRRPPELPKAIVEKLMQRDSAAFARFYSRYAWEVRWHVKGIVAPEQIDDTVQNVFIKVWQLMDRYDPLKAGLRTWLVMIARQTAIYDLRNPDSRPLPGGVLRLLDEEHHFAFDQQRHTQAQNLDHLSLQLGLAQLETQQRQLLELVYFQGVTDEEAGEALELPAGTAQAQVKSSLSQLKRFLIDSRYDPLQP